ncbi:hypothetical protein V6N12_064596 [Hibiscus sabdariffa]|uniref:Uncharacterized protein n=1 Tax=Hibiscus sabdariffa TaxID=183260 RepID=A0ABR2G690_9ROSI
MENPSPTSAPVIVQSGRSPDLAAAVPASNGPMLLAPVVTTQPGSLEDNMDMDAAQKDLRVSPCPSLRDMVAGRIAVEQRDNFISDLDVTLLVEYVIVNNFGVKYGHTKDVCGVGNLSATEGVERRQHQPSVDDRFGLWMQVVNRRRRPPMVRKAVIPDTHAVKGGSRFNVLNVEDGGNQQTRVPIT